MLQPFEPRAFELHRSRGYESERSKLLLRWSVVASDLLGALAMRRRGCAQQLQTSSGCGLSSREVTHDYAKPCVLPALRDTCLLLAIR